MTDAKNIPKYANLMFIFIFYVILYSLQRILQTFPETLLII